MAAPIVDQILKDMSEHHPEDFIRRLFPGEKFRVISTKLDKELTIKTRVTDRVMRLKTAEGDRILHIEFQLRYKPNTPRRVFVYAGALTAKYQMEVASVVFLVKPSRKIGDWDVYRSSLFGKRANEFGFRVIHLWKLRDAILSGDENYRIFAPLLLEIEPKPDVALLRKVRELIEQEQDTAKRDELYSIAIPLANQHFGLNMIKSIFTEATMTGIKWEEMPYIGDTIKAKKKEAWQEGRQEGLSGMQDMLLEVLYSRFGSVPGKTIRAIHAVQSPNKLKTIARKSLKAESLAEVQKMLPASKANGRRETINRKQARASK